MQNEPLGRFDHHPDPAIDFCVEVEVIEGMTYDASVGLSAASDVDGRIFKAMAFKVGGDEGAVNAKATLRQCEAKIRALL